MKPLYFVVVAAFLPAAAGADEILVAAGAEAAAAVAPEQGAPEAGAEAGVIAEEALQEDGVEGLLTYDATEVDLDEFLWRKRPIVIFANTPFDPAFEQQVRYIEERAQEFVVRDVVVVLDTDPSARSQARQRLRPRGFMMAIIDKDGEVKQRRPAPRTGREIMAVIDRFPLRRQEILDQLPSGRE